MTRQLRLGSMFSGYGGLDLAISEVLDAETVFVADICKVNKDGSVGHHEPHRAPCSILAHRFPGAMNLGDVSLIDWSFIEPGYRRRRTSWPPRRNPHRPLVAGRPRHHRTSTPIGGPRECPRNLHCLSRWRRGTLPVVSGRRIRRASAGT